MQCNVKIKEIRKKHIPRILGNLILEKSILQNYLFWTMVHQRGSIQFIRFFLQSFVQAKFVTSQIRHSLLSTAVFPKFLSKYFLFFFSKISHLSKNMNNFNYKY